MTMSLAAFVLLVAYVFFFGITRDTQQDEGTAAHLFQILMGGQVPIVGWFIVRWIHEEPKRVIQIAALQMVAAAIPMLVLFFLEM